MKAAGHALPLTIATAFLMEGLDSSVVTTALPAMAHDLGTTTPELAVSVTSYLASLAVFMPLANQVACQSVWRKTNFRVGTRDLRVGIPAVRSGPVPHGAGCGTHHTGHGRRDDEPRGTGDPHRQRAQV